VFSTVLKRKFIFIRLICFDCKKADYVDDFSLVSTIRATKLKLKLTATTFTKIAFPQISCNMKETSLRLYEEECVT